MNCQICTYNFTNSILDYYLDIFNPNCFVLVAFCPNFECYKFENFVLFAAGASICFGIMDLQSPIVDSHKIEY
jgi:hypothetical protein